MKFVGAGFCRDNRRSGRCILRARVAGLDTDFLHGIRIEQCCLRLKRAAAVVVRGRCTIDNVGERSKVTPVEHRLRHTVDDLARSREEDQVRKIARVFRKLLNTAVLQR